MKLFIFLGLVALVACAPASNDIQETSPTKDEDDDIFQIKEDFFNEKYKIYTSANNIVNVHFPINALNIGDDDDEYETESRYLFFVEKDDDGNNKGISVLIDDKATHLLDTGTSVASAVEDLRIAYFGATDGIYFYNATKNTAEKYGPITDNIIDIAKANGTDALYILTDKNEVYKVTENASKKELVPEAAGAKKIVLDDTNNLYFYGEDNIPKVLTAEGVKKLEGLPTPSNILLLNPAFAMEESVPVIVNNKVYFASANGTVEYESVDFDEVPKAMSVEATLMVYMVHGKALYEFNVLEIIISDAVKELKDFLNDKTDEIQALSTRSRSDI